MQSAFMMNALRKTEMLYIKKQLPACTMALLIKSSENFSSLIVIQKFQVRWNQLENVYDNFREAVITGWPWQIVIK